ncbi:MAG: acyltransferase [Limnobacter sp.]|nr:acyltransferase [Limnobacter sp.]
MTVPFSRFLPPVLTGVLTVTAMTFCVVFWFVIMLPFVVLKALLPAAFAQVATRRCIQIANCWVACNQRIYRTMHGQQGVVQVKGEFKPGRSYLVVSNHTAWADIVVLLDVLHGKSPFGRFFLKQELIWVPIVGLVCWAMDFPFMKRHASTGKASHTRLAGQDLHTAREKCLIYKKQPTTVISFLEGTRFTPAKRVQQKSAYRALLNPKYGSLAATLNAMGSQFEALVDVTIVYQPVRGNVTWSWLCGRQPRMQVHIRLLPIPQAMVLGNYRKTRRLKQSLKAGCMVFGQRKTSELRACKPAWATPIVPLCRTPLIARNHTPQSHGKKELQNLSASITFFRYIRKRAADCCINLQRLGACRI